MVLMDNLLLSTTGGHYPITSCAQPAPSTTREGEGKGTHRSPQFWGGGGLEAREQTQHFSISPSMVSCGRSSPPNRTMRVGCGVVPGSTHFMGLKRACP